MSSPIEIRETRGVRTLHFGSDWMQGAMRVNRPWDLELAYTREMMASLLLSAQWPTMPVTILQIGLGAGSLTRFVYRYLPVFAGCPTNGSGVVARRGECRAADVSAAVAVRALDH